QRRGQHARARVGDAEQLEQPLHAAVLAVAAVQRQESDVDARLAQDQVEVAVHEHRTGLVPTFGKRRQDGGARAQRHLALGREASHQDADLALSRHVRRVTSPTIAVKKTRFVVKTGAMTFLEAALEILRREGKALHYKELTERAMGKKLLTFVGRTPEVTMQTQLTAAVKKAPGNPFVRVKPGVFGLLRYPELSPEEKEAVERAERPGAGAGADEASAAEGGARGDARGDGRGRRRRRRGGRGGRGDEAAADGAVAGAAALDDDGEEPTVRGGLSAEARAAALAETGVLEGDEDGDELSAGE